jgi:hypothetical protein
VAGDCGGIDQAAFPNSALSTHRGTTTASGSCRSGPTTLCLMNGRFALAIDWSNPGNGTSGKAGAVRLPSDLTGAFFFTDPGNLELLAKGSCRDSRLRRGAVYFARRTSTVSLKTVAATERRSIEAQGPA